MTAMIRGQKRFGRTDQDDLQRCLSDTDKMAYHDKEACEMLSWRQLISRCFHLCRIDMADSDSMQDERQWIRKVGRMKRNTES